MKHVVACILLAAPVACEEPDPEPTWKTVDVAEPPAAGDPAPAEEVEEADSTATFPYPAPIVEEARALRRGRKVNLRLTWLPVEGDGLRYHVQISRMLTFTRTVKEGEVKKTKFVARKIKPQVYFWRVRAFGEGGEGAWSNMQVLDATKSGQRGRRGRRRALVAASVVEEPDEPDEPPPVSKRKGKVPRLRLVWRKPVHRLVTTESPVMVEGVATRGTMLQVGTKPALEVSSRFSVAYDLAHGRNRIVVTGQLGDQEKSLQRVIYYADPNHLAPIRERFEELRTQLEEIAAIRDELADTVQSLEARLDQEKDEALVGEIKAEMGRITQIRREIDKEINGAIGDLDRLLGG